MVSAIKNMRYIALAEATSFIALLIASVVKRTGGSELGVQILGPIHGLLFIAYVAIALNLRPRVGLERQDDLLGPGRAVDPLRRLRRRLVAAAPARSHRNLTPAGVVSEISAW